MISSYLPRKKKFLLREVNRDFYHHVVPKSMVSLRFFLNRTLESPYFNDCLSRFKKVTKLTLEDLKIYDIDVS